MGGLGYLSVLSGLVVGIVWIRIALSVASIAREKRARDHRSRAHVHAARLTFLLVALVLIDATACWAFVTLSGWNAGASLWPIVALPILGGLYFYSASLALPTGPHVWTELNGWYWITRRPVLVGILLADLVWLSLAEIGHRPDQLLLVAAGAALNLAAFIVAATSTKRRHASLALIVLIAERVALAAISPLG